MDTQYWCHINAKSTDCTVLIPSQPYARGYVGRVTNDLGIIGVGLPYKITFTLAKVLVLILVSDMSH